MSLASPELRDAVGEIATKAAELILSCKEEALASVTYKRDKSPVTVADRTANEFIVEALRRLDLNIPIVAEESPIPSSDELANGTYWVVDPLDGTKDFINETGHYTVNIALIENREPTIGVIQVPERRTLYAALKDRGAVRIDEAGSVEMQVRPASSASPTCLVSRFHQGRERELITSVYPDAKLVPAGSSLKFCLLLEGEADVYLRPFRNHEWDVAAGVLLVREAGGLVVGVPYPKDITFGESDLRCPPLLAVNDLRWVEPLAKD